RLRRVGSDPGDTAAGCAGSFRRGHSSIAPYPLTIVRRGPAGREARGLSAALSTVILQSWLAAAIVSGSAGRYYRPVCFRFGEQIFGVAADTERKKRYGETARTGGLAAHTGGLPQEDRRRPNPLCRPIECAFERKRGKSAGLAGGGTAINEQRIGARE